MSEQEAAEAAEEQPKTEAPPESGVSDSRKTDGTEKVDFSKLPEEVRGEFEARFNRLYGHMKQNERVVSDLAKQLRERDEKLAAQQQSQADAEKLAQLKAAKKAAYEAGDIDKVMALDEQILEVKIPKPEAKPEPKEPERPDWLTPELEMEIRAWGNETDDSGQLVRPWFSQGHPKYARAASIAMGVLEDPEFQGAAPKEILAEIDRLMGVKEKARPPAGAVLPTNTNARASAPKAKGLSEDQKYVARKMYPDLPIAKAYERYAAAIG